MVTSFLGSPVEPGSQKWRLTRIVTVREVTKKEVVAVFAKHLYALCGLDINRAVDVRIISAQEP